MFFSVILTTNLTEKKEKNWPNFLCDSRRSPYRQSAIRILYRITGKINQTIIG